VKERKRLRVAIVGCGKIADDHAAQIRKIPSARIVGAYDREPLMAEQFADRLEGVRVFPDFGELIRTCRPDVVHITTPPQGHYPLARECLEQGISVYVEKPFTVTADEAASLITLAEQKGLKLTVGHDLQFSHVGRRMRALIREGYLGGNPVHMESYYCYDLGDAKYARALLADKDHWIRRLPGGLLQNIVSHGIARIAEFLPSDTPEVTARGFISPALQAMGEKQIVDELRVIIRDPSGPTAYFTFSSQMRPSVRQFRVYGRNNGLFLDEDQQILVRLRGTPFKSYAERFIPPILGAGQYLGNFATNLALFLRCDFHMKAGMKFLFESFYRSIVDDLPPPIAYREILLTARIMDAIFDQVCPNKSTASSEDGAHQPTWAGSDSTLHCP
jgi:predicted dehydrogenase